MCPKFLDSESVVEGFVEVLLVYEKNYPFNAHFSYNDIIILVVTHTIPTNKVT